MTPIPWHYWMIALLGLVGLYGAVLRPNLMRKLMGINILQTAVISFYLLLAVKKGAGVPILGHHGEALAHHFINPLPHALMLTAIVVGAGTTGVALALLIRIHRRYKTLDEREILAQIESEGREGL